MRNSDNEEYWTDLLARARSRAHHKSHASEDARPLPPINVIQWRVHVKVRAFRVFFPSSYYFHQPGMEEVLAFRLFRKIIAESNVEWKISSIIGRSSLPGWIIFETSDVNMIRVLCDGMVGIHARDIYPVDPTEGPVYLREPTNSIFQVNSWVRLKRQPYKGDLALVKIVDPAFIQVLVVPRIDYRVYARGKRPRNIRPPQALFDPIKAQSIFGSKSVKKHDQTFYFRRKEFTNGFLSLKVETCTQNPIPKREELTTFALNPSIPQQCIQAAYALVTAPEFTIGDNVRVLAGASRGSLAKIVGLHSEEAEVCFVDDNVTSMEKLMNLRKRVLIGDMVVVSVGAHEGLCGWVVGIAGEMVTVCEPKLVKYVRSLLLSYTYLHFFFG